MFGLLLSWFLLLRILAGCGKRITRQRGRKETGAERRAQGWNLRGPPGKKGDLWTRWAPRGDRSCLPRVGGLCRQGELGAVMSSYKHTDTSAQQCAFPPERWAARGRCRGHSSWQGTAWTQRTTGACTGLHFGVRPHWLAAIPEGRCFSGDSRFHKSSLHEVHGQEALGGKTLVPA